MGASDRQLYLLEYLATNRRYGVTRAQIKAHLDVDARTIRRYVARLRDNGWRLMEQERDDGARVLRLTGLPSTLDDLPRG